MSREDGEGVRLGGILSEGVDPRRNRRGQMEIKGRKKGTDFVTSR